MLYSVLRPWLFRMDPEQAHHFTLRMLDKVHALGLLGAITPRLPACPRTVMGLTFPNPVGLAAGLDKDGAHINALGGLGFGFLEVGTVTPRPQPGNPHPRLFRLPEAQALINRMGFNNAGVDTLLENVRRARYDGILGINIGKNFDTPIAQAADDYLYCLEKVYPHASYVTVNISSPNTQNLRQLQGADELASLLGQLKSAQARLHRRHDRYVPLAVKIAPDLDAEAVASVAATLLHHEVDAVIATNTTLSRELVAGHPLAGEAGGLSGRPVQAASTRVIAQLSQAVGGKLPIIGVGGILSGEEAREKIAAGASLVQLYSGLIYRGPDLVAESVRTLCRAR